MGLFQAFNWLADRVGDGVRAVADVAGDVLRPIGDAAGDVIKGVGDAIVKVVDYGADVVRAIAKDPLPTLLSYAGMAVGIPPYITSAVITAARGGNLEDIAKSAAISYATTSFMSDTQIGADIKNYTTNAWAGDFTDSMVQNFDLPLDTAMQVYKVASSTLNSSLTGGINAALTGQSIAEGISSGFASGLVYSGTNSYFDSVNKDPSWGFSPKALEVMKGATATALNTAILGKKDAKGNLIDPAQAVGNYLAYASLNMAGSEVYKQANNAYANFTKATTDVDKAGSKYSVADEQYKTKLEESEVLRVAINNDSSAYQKTIDEKYTPFKTNYDNLIAKYGKAVEDYNYIKGSYEFEIDTYNNNTIIDASTRASVLRGIREKETITLPQYSATANALSDQANKLYADNKNMLDGLTTQSAAINNNVEEFNAIKFDIETPEGSIHEDNSVFAKINSKFSGTPLALIDDRNTAQKLLDASNEYQSAYDAWSATKATADQSAENYTKSFAEVATRDATIDALNSGVITATQKDDDGNYVLSNGMTLNKDGTFFQDGVQQFTNAAGINQRELDFTQIDDEQIAALKKGQVTAIDADPTRYVPIQNVDANNKNVIAASDALSAAVTRDGTPKNATFSPAYADGDSYVSYVKSSDIDGNPTGYRMRYYPDNGEIIYSWDNTSDEDSVDENGKIVLPMVYINTSRKPPKFDSTTGAFVNSSGQLVQAPAQTPPEPSDVAEKPVNDPNIKNPFDIDLSNVGTLLAIYGDGTSLVKSDDTGKQSIVKTSGDATVGSKVDLTVDAKTGETTAVVKTPDAITPVAPSAGTPAGNVSGTPAGASTETTPPVDLVNTTAGAGTTTGATTGATTTGAGTGAGATTGTTTDAGTTTGTTTGATAGTTTGVPAGTKDLMSQFNSRVDQLIGSGKTSGEAVSIAYQEINLGLSDIQKNAFEQEKAAAEKVIADKAAADKAAKDKAAADKLALKIYTNRSSANASNAAQQKAANQGALSLLQPAATSASDLASVAGPLAAGYLMAKEDPNKFESPLDKFLKLQDQSFGKENQYGTQVQGTPMNDPSYSYGTQRPIGDILNMGSSQSTQASQASQAPDASTQNYFANLPYAKGGRAGTRHGKYAQGGLSTPLMASGGKMRVDFRHGDAVTGAGDGQSDDIPAMLADGEFVFPADVVAAVGNGSTKAGSDKLYDMMHSIRAHARSAKPKDLPPQIKSPLDFLKRTA